MERGTSTISGRSKIFYKHYQYLNLGYTLRDLEEI